MPPGRHSHPCPHTTALQAIKKIAVVLLIFGTGLCGFVVFAYQVFGPYAKAFSDPVGTTRVLLLSLRGGIDLSTLESIDRAWSMIVRRPRFSLSPSLLTSARSSSTPSLSLCSSWE